MNIDQQWKELSRTINESIRQNGRLPEKYNKGDKVRRDVDGKVYTVKRSYWQSYGEANPGDWTVELESIDPSQPTPWDKSTNLEPVEDLHSNNANPGGFCKIPFKETAAGQEQLR